MRKSLIFVFGILCLLIGCKSESSKGQYESLTYDTSKIAIISWANAPRHFRDRNINPAPLTQRDLKAIDSLLIVCITTRNQELNLPDEYSKEDEIDLVTGNYKQQLIAYKNPDGEKEVWVNCFCTYTGSPFYFSTSWKTSIITVKDGGPCYFRLTINLTKKTFRDLMVNGRA